MAVFKNWWVRYTLAFTVILIAHLAYGGYFTRVPITVAPVDFKPENVQNYLLSIWQGHAPAGDLDPLLRQNGLCWVTGFRGGYLDNQEISLWEDRGSALQRLLRDPHWRECEAVEVGVATNVTNYNQQVVERPEMGLWGLLLRCSNGDLCLTPCEFPRRSEFVDGQALKYQLERTVLRQASFQALTWVLRRDAEFRPLPIVRGEIAVLLEAVNRDSIVSSVRNLAGFQQGLVRAHEGLLPYVYTVATGLFSEDERKLDRVCLGSLSLAKYARWTGREEDRQLSEKHLKTMIARYGHSWDNKTCLADSDVALLGAQALFALALHTQPLPDASLQEFEEGLGRTILGAMGENGQFQTSWPLPGTPRPEPVDPEKDYNQNVFPGMALSYLSQRTQVPHPLVTLETLDRSLQYYLTRFRRRPDRSAIPWLTESFRMRYVINQDRKSAETAFTLVDWNLNNLQEWKKMEPFLRGSLVNADRLQYGKSCSTADVGGQLQALVASDWLAERLSVKKRYDTEIQEMSRYLMQMQMRSKSDLYWLPPNLRKTPLGGLRDVPWNYTMQVDSGASALNAWLDWVNP